MTSQIDPSHPATGYAYTQNVRDNFETAAQEITALQAAVASLQTLVTQLQARRMAAATVITANPPNTNANTFVMAGLKLAFTPPTSTRAIVLCNGQLGNTTNAAVTDAQLVFGVGTPPNAGAPFSGTNGTVIGEPASMSASRANDFGPFSVSGLLTVQPGTSYWFDVAYQAESGSATLSEMSITAFELLDPIS